MRRHRRAGWAHGDNGGCSGGHGQADLGINVGWNGVPRSWTLASGSARDGARGTENGRRVRRGGGEVSGYNFLGLFGGGGGGGGRILEEVGGAVE